MECLGPQGRGYARSPLTPRAFRQILGQKQAGLAAAHDIQVSVAIDIHDIAFMARMGGT